MNLKVTVLLLSFLLLLGAPAPTLASGNLATSSASAAGELKTVSQDGALFLSTQANDAQAQPPFTIRQGKLSLLGGKTITIPQGFAISFAQWLNAILSFVMVIAGLLVLLYLIWGGFDWITSGGDKSKIEQARQKLQAAVIGLIIVSSSFAILVLAIRFLGFQDLNDVFNSVQGIDGSGGIRSLQSTSPSPSTIVNPSSSPQYSDSLKDLLP